MFPDLAERRSEVAGIHAGRRHAPQRPDRWTLRNSAAYVIFPVFLLSSTAIAAYNITILGYDAIPVNMSGLGNSIAHMEALNPDILVAGASAVPDLSATVLQAIRNADYQPRAIFVPSGPGMPLPLSVLLLSRPYRL